MKKLVIGMMSSYENILIKYKGINLRTWPELTFAAFVLVSWAQGIMINLKTPLDWKSKAPVLLFQPIFGFAFGLLGTWMHKSLLKKGLGVGFVFFMLVGISTYLLSLSSIVLIFSDLKSDLGPGHPSLVLSGIGYAYIFKLRMYLKQENR